MIDYSIILTKRYNGNEWYLNGDDYEGLVWLSENTKPTKKELDNLWASVKEEIELEKIEKERVRQEALLKLEQLGLTQEELKSILQ